jgi:hypothetical protein
LTRPSWAQARCWRPPSRWRSFRSRRRLGLCQILPRVETTPRVPLLPRAMSDSAGAVCLEYACVFRGHRGLNILLSCYIKLCFLSSCFEYPDLFVGSRIVYPSESYFSWKVTSEVSVSRRCRSPSARSALPLTCALTGLQDSVIDIVKKHESCFGRKLFRGKF